MIEIQFVQTDNPTVIDGFKWAIKRVWKMSWGSLTINKISTRDIQLVMSYARMCQESNAQLRISIQTNDYSWAYLQPFQGVGSKIWRLLMVLWWIKSPNGIRIFRFLLSIIQDTWHIVEIIMFAISNPVKV